MSPTYLPPEWSKQKAILLTWPHKHSDWASLISEIDSTFVEITKTVSLYQRVIISCFNQSHKEHVKKLLKNREENQNNIELFVSPSNDCWVRDHGPISVIKNDRIVLLNFIFNGWGNKFESRLDNNLTGELHQQGAFNSTALLNKNFVLEGGSIDVDGNGGLLTSSRCLLAPSRNPGKNQRQIETQLMQDFGVTRIYWLHHGYLSGDDTDAHIDTLARFTDGHTIAYSACTDRKDEQYVSLKKMEHELSHFRDYNGNPFELIPLPTPKPIFDSKTQRLPANYSNFLIINHAVLVPIYNDPADAFAIKQLKKCFHNRKIIGINCLTLIQQAGSLHCATMQLPAKPLATETM